MSWIGRPLSDLGGPAPPAETASLPPLRRAMKIHRGPRRETIERDQHLRVAIGLLVLAICLVALGLAR